VRAVETRYSVPGWGVGELWTRGDLVLAHEFDFRTVSDTAATARTATAQADVRDRAMPSPRIGLLDAESPCEVIDTPLARVPLDTERCLTPKELVERFAAFLAGEDVGFDDVALDLDTSSSFQLAVAASLRAIPRGEIVSYGELAALSGYAGAARAVGTFCARNRFMFLVPCHRVVGAVGIGGYGSAGVGVKRRLLALEGIAL
jgi:methylated-DNA-[protein]-cysteine S-methyltransferase